MSLVKQKMERYLMPMIPMAALVAGYGLNYLSGTYLPKIQKGYLVLGFLALNLAFVMYFFPNYLIHPSESGKDQFGCSLCSDVGEYLNDKENPSDLKIVYSSNKVHRIQPFVKGRVYSPNEDLPNGWTAEYFLKANHESLPEEYSHCELEKDFTFRGTEYLNLHNCK